MKYRYLSIILLILIFSLGAVSAQDNATDVISADSDDVISIEEAPVLQDNGTSADEIHINDVNFNQYFDENDTMNDNVSAGSTIFIGEITNKSLFINKQVFVVPDETSKITDSIIAFISGSDGSTIEGLTFNNTDGCRAISVWEANDIVVFKNIINIVSNTNMTDSAIFALYANNFNATANVITYNGKSDGNNTVIHVVDSNDVEIDMNEINFSVVTNGTYRNNAILGEGCEDLVISNNNIYAYLPSRSVDWGTGVVYSEGVCLDNCDYALLDNNTVSVTSNDKIGDYDTIYAVHITGDNASVINSRMRAIYAPYGYALVISGKNYLIQDNHIVVADNGSYACGIDVESNSDGFINNNEFIVMGESAYGIYTADWAGDVKANITENRIEVYGTNVFGMSLTGSEVIVDNNIIFAVGNFTTGIASAADMIFITNNKIIANGTNVGTPTGYDTMGIETIGVHIVSGDALVKNNTIEANSKYAVSVEGTGAVTDNEIHADMLTGDFAVDYSQDSGVLVANNTPAMELTYELTNDTFFIYFDENGEIREQIDADNLTFIGPFSNLVDGIQIGKPVKLLSDNATIINIPILVVSDNVTIDGFNFINNKSVTISAYESDNIKIVNNTFNVTGNPDSSNVVIAIGESNNGFIYNNTIAFKAETNETFTNKVIYASGSDDLFIEGNIINASLPSRSINWTSGEVYSEGVFLDGCNDANLTNNTIIVMSNGNIGEYDTIYAVHITGDVAMVDQNIIAVGEAPYGYALVIAGEDFDISNNVIVAAQNGTYACGIDVESNSNGVIDSNFIVAFGSLLMVFTLLIGQVMLKPIL